MHCEEVRSLLADAVGRELTTLDSRRLEQHTAECVECRDSLTSLRDTAAALRALAPAGPATAAQIATIPFPRPPRSGARETLVVLRYAAVIFLAFAAGYLSRGFSVESRYGSPTPVTDAGASRPAAADALESYIARNYPRVASEHPNVSQLGLSLLSLARR